MSEHRKALIVVENSFVPLDIRVWYEATTLRDDGWQVAVICPAPFGVHAESELPLRFDAPINLEGISVNYFPIQPANEGVLGYLFEYLAAFFSIGRLAWRVWRQAPFDILQICNPPDLFFPIAWFYRSLGVRIIFDHHDLFPEFVSHRFHGLLGRLLYGITRAMEYLTYHCAHLTISVNESYRNIAIQRGRVSPDNLITVRNGPKAKEFSPVEPIPALKKGFPLLACYLGVMGHEDGVLEMVESIQYLISELGRRDIFFILIGDGALYTRALQMIKDWGLEENVEMHGMISNKLTIRQYLSTADICLSPEPLTPLNASSTFIKVGEYMAMGKPIVAYELKETRVTAQDSALYVKPGDIHGFAHAITVLADHPEQRLTMGTYARKRFLEQVCWEHQQGNLLKAYRNVLDRKT